MRELLTHKSLWCLPPCRPCYSDDTIPCCRCYSGRITNKTAWRNHSPPRSLSIPRLPRIDYPPDSDFSLVSPPNSPGCNLATSGVMCSTRGSVTRENKRGKVPPKADHKALDLAAARVRLLRAGDTVCEVGGPENTADDGLVSCVVSACFSVWRTCTSCVPALEIF